LLYGNPRQFRWQACYADITAGIDLALALIEEDHGLALVIRVNPHPDEQLGTQ
jgi:hypothetical protein